MVIAALAVKYFFGKNEGSSIALPPSPEKVGPHMDEGEV